MWVANDSMCSFEHTSIAGGLVCALSCHAVTSILTTKGTSCSSSSSLSATDGLFCSSTEGLRLESVARGVRDFTGNFLVGNRVIPKVIGGEHAQRPAGLSTSKMGAELELELDRSFGQCRNSSAKMVLPDRYGKSGTKRRHDPILSLHVHPQACDCNLRNAEQLREPHN